MKIKNFAEQNGIEFVVLFGSQVKGSANENSDFDIAILKYSGQSFFSNLREYYDVLSKLAECLSIPSQKLDLVDLSHANILLRRQITKGGKLIYGDSSLYEDYKSFAYRDFIDAKPLFDLESEIINFRYDFLKRTLA